MPMYYIDPRREADRAAIRRKRDAECTALGCDGGLFGGHAENCRTLSHRLAEVRALEGRLTARDRERYALADARDGMED